jgi:hypothetical protein
MRSIRPTSRLLSPLLLLLLCVSATLTHAQDEDDFHSTTEVSETTSEPDWISSTKALSLPSSSSSSAVCASHLCSEKLENTLTVAVLLPHRMKECDPLSLAPHNRLELVLPAIALLSAPSSWLNAILPGWKLSVLRGDTECSSTLGPLRAFELHCQAGARQTAHCHCPFTTASMQ